MKKKKITNKRSLKRQNEQNKQNKQNKQNEKLTKGPPHYVFPASPLTDLAECITCKSLFDLPRICNRIRHKTRINSRCAKMEYLILEEKYKNLLNKSNHEKAVLKKESEALRKKLQNLEGAYIEKEKEVAEILGEKESLEDRLSKMGRKNESLEEEIVKLNEKIVDLTDLSKTYRQMIRSRNKELQHAHFLVAENMNLRSSLELAQSEKIELENELGKKKNIIQLIKDKYKNNIGR
ncbi:hypothetical protein PVMG_03391 [Plasmodium vivax Mauritania I]|uniref:Uncharacterized protein n=1 Tax=Plasmodium vivax Mauritania I TaxID=1035515 RepID=A0A0J9T788_PLAVI|nr:hypothetical protein PVMG_03391 [Plasmodium vivax Mauritania I]